MLQCSASGTLSLKKTLLYTSGITQSLNYNVVIAILIAANVLQGVCLKMLNCVHSMHALCVSMYIMCVMCMTVLNFNVNVSRHFLNTFPPLL